MKARSIRLAAIACLIVSLPSASARAQKLLLFEKSDAGPAANRGGDRGVLQVTGGARRD